VLRDLNIKAVYNSENDHILNDFYIPALNESISYDRAVGYFTPSVLISAARGLSNFINNNGQMRLICGATLSEDEYLAISEGYKQREFLEKFESDFTHLINSNETGLLDFQLNALKWLVAHNKLDVKIALRRHGIHHQKTGILKDENGDFVVFQGSANETNNALKDNNYEVINVFKSWQPEMKDHYEPHINEFSRLWENLTTNTLVLDFTEITLKILNTRDETLYKPKIKDELFLWQDHLDASKTPVIFDNRPAIPQKLSGHDFKLHDHQENALNNWKNQNFKGLFELATGSGKTITAIYGAVKMFISRKRLFVIIAVPYQNLADQWAGNLADFKIKPTICYGGEHRWRSDLKQKILAFNSGHLDFCAVVVVDATLSSNNRTFHEMINSIHPDFNKFLMFIGDECHHHGSEKISKVLPTNADLRIGLSATPDRGEGDIGNEIIADYYGDVVAEYTLKDALEDKKLTPYEYHLIPVELTQTEAEKYIDLSNQISRLYAQLQNNKNNQESLDRLNILLNKRSRVINGSENKPKALIELIKPMKPISHSLFYCAEGKVDNDDNDGDDEGMKQIEVISNILNDFGWKSCQFTANENKQRRTQILENFKNKKVDSLVAMKCLDEGVDIPACGTAFILSSSRKPRQFVQRRGRILRKSPGKEKSVIYDFFVTLPLESLNEKEIQIGRKLIIAELKRIKEFAELSINKRKAYAAMEDYLRKFDLFHHI